MSPGFPALSAGSKISRAECFNPGLSSTKVPGVWLKGTLTLVGLGFFVVLFLICLGLGLLWGQDLKCFCM